MGDYIRKMRRIILVSLCLALLILLLLVVYFVFFTDETPTGKIVFRLPPVPFISGKYRLIIADSNLNGMHEISLSTGPPTFSPDGKFLAVGCQDPTNLCIYDVSAFGNYRKYPIESPNHPILEKKFPLPDACQSTLQQDRFPELESISWSPEGERLIVVCEVDYGAYEACIIALSDGTPQCWDGTEIDGKVTSAVWSPVEDRVAITVSGGIYLVDSNGENSKFLVEGWSPEWSPEGKRIAFLRFDEDARFDEDGLPLAPVIGRNIYGGIAVINIDGTHSEWIYRYPPYGSNDMYTEIWPFCENFKCRLAWSPDDRYIAFNSSLGVGHLYYIFRIDLNTNEIRILSPNISHYYSKPDWGP